MQFTARLYCRKCKKVTPQRIYYAKVFSDYGEVIFGHLCMGENYTSESGFCFNFTEDHIKIRDYNALVGMGREDFPYEFDKDDENNL